MNVLVNRSQSTRLGLLLEEMKSFWLTTLDRQENALQILELCIKGNNNTDTITLNNTDHLFIESVVEQ